MNRRRRHDEAGAEECCKAVLVVVSDPAYAGGGGRGGREGCPSSPNPNNPGRESTDNPADNPGNPLSLQQRQQTPSPVPVTSRGQLTPLVTPGSSSQNRLNHSGLSLFSILDSALLPLLLPLKECATTGTRTLPIPTSEAITVTYEAETCTCATQTHAKTYITDIASLPSILDLCINQEHRVAKHVFHFDNAMPQQQ